MHVAHYNAETFRCEILEGILCSVVVQAVKEFSKSINTGGVTAIIEWHVFESQCIAALLQQTVNMHDDTLSYGITEAPERSQLYRSAMLLMTCRSAHSIFTARKLRSLRTSANMASDKINDYLLSHP